ncbi:MAG: MBL fold metallo-hydrolase [Candidatus Eisenbacteria bacterium]|nr:MBL fold metallo-hydrolase [Candidatus Eisenbacteria bacterium]
MKFTAYGAARNVTGTKHLLEVGGKRILLDCGLFQGHRADSDRRNRRLPFAPASVDAVLLTHAHIDHSGNLPTLVKGGFNGPIHATHATVDLCGILLTDTAYIQGHDLEYLNKRRRKRGEAPLDPIYTERDVEDTLPKLVGVDYDTPIRVARGVSVIFRDAGHILGSSILEIDANESGRTVRVVFTGDLGRSNMPILRDPYQVTRADVLVIESTYGNRTHSPMEDVKRSLADFVSSVARRRGKVIVPSFAVGRTQRIVYELHELMRGGLVPEIPIYVDSPLAVSATEIFRRHPECFDEDMNRLLRENDDPLGFSRVQYIREAEESKKLNRKKGPMIIISASGMCEAGRILHHLKNNISNRRNGVMIVGYQAENTLGRRIALGENRVRIFGDVYPVRARVRVFDEFSAHADTDELAAFAKGIRRIPSRTIIVHGNEEQSIAFGRRMTAEGFPNVIVPLDGETIPL